MNTPHQPLPAAEFGSPGPLRDALVTAILDGAKTATTSLLAAYEQTGEPLPRPGALSAVLDSRRQPVAVIECTEVRVVPLAEVPLGHIRDEGEGHTTRAQWRAAHEEFWHSAEVRAELGGTAFVTDDATPVVLERFRLTEAQSAADRPGNGR